MFYRQQCFFLFFFFFYVSITFLIIVIQSHVISFRIFKKCFSSRILLIPWRYRYLQSYMYTIRNILCCYIQYRCRIFRSRIRYGCPLLYDDSMIHYIISYQTLQFAVNCCVDIMYKIVISYGQLIASQHLCYYYYYIFLQVHVKFFTIL